MTEAYGFQFWPVCLVSSSSFTCRSFHPLVVCASGFAAERSRDSPANVKVAAILPGLERAAPMHRSYPRLCPVSGVTPPASPSWFAGARAGDTL